MGAHSPARVLLVLLSALAFITALVFNALAGSGSAPFLQSTGNVSGKYSTDITPSGWTFSIWGLIYTWLSAMLVYVLSGLCRRTSGGWMYCSPAVLPYGFFLSWMWNMILNVVWLFLWDKEQTTPCLVVLALIAFTNYLAVFFSSHGLHVYGAWLYRYHKVDLWLLRVLAQNGVAMYATWTTIATLLNLAIVLEYSAGMSEPDAGTVALSILLMDVIAWVVVQNLVLERHVRYVLIVYPVVIMALTGSITKNYNAASPSPNNMFTAALLASACVAFVLQLGLLLWRQRMQPLYHDSSVEAPMSPVDIAQKQRLLFI